jgi:hypothetical protein
VRGDRLCNLQQGLVPLRESFTGGCGMRFHRSQYGLSISNASRGFGGC